MLPTHCHDKRGSRYGLTKGSKETVAAFSKNVHKKGSEVIKIGGTKKDIKESGIWKGHTGCGLM